MLMSLFISHSLNSPMVGLSAALALAGSALHRQLDWELLAAQMRCPRHGGSGNGAILAAVESTR
jgi:hypothetical protein